MHKTLEKILHFGLYAAPFTALLIIPGTFFAFVFARGLLFQILIEILAIIWVVLAIKRGPSIKKTFVFWTVIVFWGVNFLATIWSVSPHVSFFGKGMRVDGLMMFTHLILWFLLLASEINSKPAWMKFFKINAILAGVVATVGVLQYFFSIWPGAIYKSGRVFSFLGNPNFLAGYLLLPIFISAYFIFDAAKKSQKVFWGALLAVDLAAFYNTKSRGAMAGLLAGVVIAILVFLFGGRVTKKIKILGAIFLTLLVLAVGSILFLVKTGKIQSFPAIQRFASIDLENFRPRLIGAEIAWKGIMERPVLGWGPSNFDLIFDKYYNPESLKFSFAETVWDKPHNYLLEAGTSAGLPGIAAYLGIYFAAFWVIWRSRAELGNLFAGISAGLLLAKFVNALASFETLDTLIILFAFLAYLNFLHTRGKALKIIKPKFLAVAAIMLVIIGLGLISNLKNLSSSAVVTRASGALYLNKIAWRESVLELLKVKSSYRDDMVNLAFIDLTAWEAREGNIDEMLSPVLLPLTSYLEDAEKRNPWAYIYPFELGQVLGMRCEYLGEADSCRVAIAALDRAIKNSPSRQSIYLIKGKVYLTLGETDKAIEAIRAAVAVYPVARDPHWFLGLVLVAAGERAEGLKELAAGKVIGELSPPVAGYLISLYAEEKLYDKIVPIYEHLILTDPAHAAEYWANLAATYLELKNKDKASEAASQALTLDPSLRTVIGAFMKKLEKLQ